MAVIPVNRADKNAMGSQSIPIASDLWKQKAITAPHIRKELFPAWRIWPLLSMSPAGLFGKIGYAGKTCQPAADDWSRSEQKRGDGLRCLRNGDRTKHAPPGQQPGGARGRGRFLEFYKRRRYSKKEYLVPRPFSSAPWYSMAAVATSCTAMPTVSKMVISWSFSRPGF